MKLPLSWLNEHVALTQGMDEISETLTRLGIEVEGIEMPRKALAGVVVGHIIDAKPHPDADRLQLLKVDTGGDEPLAIVCGATNMKVGDHVPVATIGTSLPNGLTIKKGKIRGETSCGMCCSEVELGLADEADGLLILPADVPVGMNVAEYMDMEEAIFDLSITPNRGDCMSVRGVARDLAAFFNLSLQEALQESFKLKSSVGPPEVQVDEAEDCPVYMARRIEGVSLHPSPDWIQQRLIAAGQRPVHGVVDVLNYVMLEIGQPMHAFDADEVSDGISVRHAKKDEAFGALDGRELKLGGDDLVIADGNGVIALAGAMGSEASGVTGKTTNIVLESAAFRAACISLTARRYGMVSEASMRFERGVDAAMVSLAMELATGLILKLFGGKAGSVNVCGDIDVLLQKREITFPASRISSHLGEQVPDTIDDVLKRMGFGIERQGDNLQVKVPTHRHDVSLAEDIIEEYARIYGYEHIPECLPNLQIGRPTVRDQSVDKALQAGFVQVITYAFIAADEQRLFVADSSADVRLSNPISDAMSVMRSSLWPGLLKAASHNLNRQQSGVALVEKGRTYEKRADGYSEHNKLAWLLAGEIETDEWFQSAGQADFFDMKGEVESWMNRMGLTARFIADDGIQGLQAGQSAKIVVGRAEVGCIGKIDADIAGKLDIEADVFVAEIDLDTLPKARAPKYAPLPEFPGVARDLVFLFDRKLTSEDILKAANQAGGKLLTGVRIFDRYVGKGVPENKISLGIRFTLQAMDRTLTQEDSDAASAAIVAAMQKKFGAPLRGG